ncbi:MAG: alpha-beta hydrolase superfamily lysophospholipase, partial [Arenicella sp.]
AMNECQSRASAINLPIRIMHGSGDVMTASAGSELLYNKVSSTDKELKIYDSLFHEIFNEPEAPEIYKEIIDWLGKRS